MDSKQDLKEEIARVAYEIYKREGTTSSEVVNWLKAERIVLERLTVPEPPDKPGKLVSSAREGGTRKKKTTRSIVA
jgi:hypothetical protein